MKLIESLLKVFLIIIENDTGVIFDIKTSYFIFILMGIQRFFYVIN